MAFIFEIEYDAPYRYICDFIKALAEEEGAVVSVVQSRRTITLIGNEADRRLVPFLQKLAENLPASLFTKGSGHRIIDKPMPNIGDEIMPRLPHAIGLCPRCTKEMLDPASRRYYYPFTACNCCGAHYPFFESYPYERTNTLMRFLVPCERCEEELQSNPFRRDYPLISCHACGIPVRINDAGSEHRANDAGSFEKLFEIAAKAIENGKRVRIKTLNGWRLFFDAAQVKTESEKVMLMLDTTKFEYHCAVNKDEVHAVSSIERPMIRAAVSNENLIDLYGKTTPLKYPDDGFTTLLARELMRLGYEHVAYLECDFDTDADCIVDYDVAIEPQRDTHLFIYESGRFFVEGERGIFPFPFERRADRIVVAHEMATVPWREGVLIDRMEKFDSAEASALYLLEKETVPLKHSNTIRFSQETASVLSVLMEHGKERESAIGVYFGEEPTFIHHNGKKPIVAVPAMEFAAGELREKIASLREGSDQLVANFESKYPKLAERLFGSEGARNIFEAAAVIMDLPEKDFDAIGREAMKFQGKGGLQIDTKVDGNRFDPYAFAASLISYRLAGVESVLLAYSIFESFGDYVVEIASQLKVKAKAEHIVLCGRAFGNPSLFSRVQKKFGHQNFLMNRVLPIDRENLLLGALAL
ncbi:hypothetical protein [Hydrogenimonas sp.]|uniref:hypothetical protein n=1 Tax=Hydrogenimonas sp. TaxID=2231112 RepID=UPI002620CCBC|nr:hypothetical protein [Hydrogenimonas sp.]